MSKRRQSRLSDLLQEEISRILFQKMNDPRLSLCSISKVTLSPDYRHARVYVSALGSPREREHCLRALNSAEGYFRKEMRKLKLKYIPTLQFSMDTALEYSQHIEELLQSVRKEGSEE